MSFDKDQENND